MKTLILYMTQHGCTERVAEIMQERIFHTVDLINLKENDVSLHSYDQIIIGGSIHAGSIQKKLRKFLHANENTLLTKEIGLFICCMHTGEQAELQFKKAFSKKLRQHAKATALAGGVFDFERMNFFEKLIIRNVAKVHDNTEILNVDAIKSFSNKFNVIRHAEVKL